MLFKPKKDTGTGKKQNCSQVSEYSQCFHDFISILMQEAEAKLEKREIRRKALQISSDSLFIKPRRISFSAEF